MAHTLTENNDGQPFTGNHAGPCAGLVCHLKSVQLNQKPTAPMQESSYTLMTPNTCHKHGLGVGTSYHVVKNLGAGD